MVSRRRERMAAIKSNTRIMAEVFGRGEAARILESPQDTIRAMTGQTPASQKIHELLSGKWFDRLYPASIRMNNDMSLLSKLEDDCLGPVLDARIIAAECAGGVEWTSVADPSARRPMRVYSPPTSDENKQQDKTVQETTTLALSPRKRGRKKGQTDISREDFLRRIEELAADPEFVLSQTKLADDLKVHRDTIRRYANGQHFESWRDLKRYFEKHRQNNR